MSARKIHVLSLVAVFFTSGSALQLLGSNSSGPGVCYNGPKLHFVHVMKDGGESVDSFFVCLSTKLKFAVSIREGPDNTDFGDTSCPPSFCAAHHPAVEKAEVCGDGFSTARSFTVLREPVSRLFSLFNYFKYCSTSSHYSSFETFGDFLRDMAQSTSDRSMAWKNDMDKFWFSPNPITLSFASGGDAEMKLRSQYEATQDDLTDAKRVLSKLDAIFLTEHLDHWQTDYLKSGLPFSQVAYDVHGHPLCEMEHTNACDCLDHGCRDAPTDEEIKLASKMNNLDVQLYDYVQTLSNQFST